MKKVAVIGAGKTGRGFIGRLLQEANQEIIFKLHLTEERGVSIISLIFKVFES